MSAFTVTKSNQAAMPTQLRVDLDMNLQLCQATDRRKMSLYEANLLAFEGTTATRSTHNKFLVALLGEVERYQRVNKSSNNNTKTTVSAPQDMDLLQTLHKQHETLMEAFPDRDVYGQSVALIAQKRVFTATNAKVAVC
eukprot:337094_1